MKTNISISLDKKTLAALKLRAAKEQRSLSNIISVIIDKEIPSPQQKEVSNG